MIRKSQHSVKGYHSGSLSNETDEAYTGNLVGRRGIRTPLSNSAPKESLVTVDDVVNDAEVNTVVVAYGEIITGQSGSKSVAC